MQYDINVIKEKIATLRAIYLVSIFFIVIDISILIMYVVTLIDTKIYLILLSFIGIFSFLFTKFLIKYFSETIGDEFHTYEKIKYYLFSLTPLGKTIIMLDFLIRSIILINFYNMLIEIYSNLNSLVKNIEAQ